MNVTVSNTPAEDAVNAVATKVSAELRRDWYIKITLLFMAMSLFVLSGLAWGLWQVTTDSNERSECRGRISTAAAVLKEDRDYVFQAGLSAALDDNDAEVRSYQILLDDIGVYIKDFRPIRESAPEVCRDNPDYDPHHDIPAYTVPEKG